MGVRDYVLKSGFSKVVIGLSGGIDSAVTAAIAVDALGAQNVLGISLPSSISSEHSKQDAKELAGNLGIEFHTISIQSLVSAASSELDFLFRDLSEDVTEENLQARSRGLLLMALSNKFNALLLTTGNKSELAVGYCTLYGDMCGGLAVISDVPKMKVFELAKHFNRQKFLFRPTLSRNRLLQNFDQIKKTVIPYPIMRYLMPSCMPMSSRVIPFRQLLKMDTIPMLSEESSDWLT